MLKKFFQLIQCRKNTGAIIILVAGVLLFFVIFFLVVGIDFAYVYYVRGEVQAAADSAALAGAVKLDGTNSTVQTDARTEAVKFAGKNFAAKSPLVLASDGSNSLTNNNDITVGNWDYAQNPKYLAGRTPINAVQVVARRTKDSPGGEVGLIFQKIVQGLVSMGIKREAIATRPPTPTNPMSLCIDACNLVVPPGGIDLFFKEQQAPSPSQAVAWTEFSTSKSTNFGPDSLIAQYIRGEAYPPNVCGVSITTNNAGSQQIMGVLSDEYDKQKDTSGRWQVISAVLDAPCPPGSQPSEPFEVKKYAIIGITRVVGNPTPSVRIDSISCIPCPALEILGKRSYLVK